MKEKMNPFYLKQENYTAIPPACSRGIAVYKSLLKLLFLQFQSKHHALVAVEQSAHCVKSRSGSRDLCR